MCTLGDDKNTDFRSVWLRFNEMIHGKCLGLNEMMHGNCLGLNEMKHGKCLVRLK